MGRQFEAVRACVFDAYGTLFDVASAVMSCAYVLGERADALTTLWREKQLQYSWLRSLQGRYADFERVTADALDFAMETLGVADPELRELLLGLYRYLEPFPEAADALGALKAAGLPTAILSNGSPEMLADLVSMYGLDDLLDAVLSVHDVRIYKPAAAVYQLAVDHFALSPDEICFVSSNGWDAYGASAFGLRVVWCNRNKQRPERLPGAPDAQIRTLAELPRLLIPGG